MEIYNAFLKLYAENQNGITVNQVAKECALSPNRTRELLKQLLDAGFLSREKDGREFLYHTTEKRFQNISIENIEFNKTELDDWLHQQLGSDEGYTVINRTIRDVVLYESPQK